MIFGNPSQGKADTAEIKSGWDEDGGAEVNNGSYGSGGGYRVIDCSLEGVM